MSQGKDLFQGLLEATINHYTREGIVAAIDFISELSEQDLKEWTEGMAPDETERVYRVWRASQKNGIVAAGLVAT